MTLLQILLVAVGGVFGSLLRWQVIETLPTLSLGVFAVNQLGVLAAGYVAYRMKTTINQRLFWITGCKKIEVCDVLALKATQR